MIKGCKMYIIITIVVVVIIININMLSYKSL